MWTRRRSMMYVLVISLIVHAGVLAAVHRSTGRIDTYAFNSLDGREYYQIAKNLVEHTRFSQSTEPPLEPDTWRTPGYPLFLAAIMLFCGDSPAAMVVAQQLVGLGNVLLLFGIARRSLGDRRAAIVSGLFLLEPYHLYYSLWLMATTLFVTVILLTWQAWQTAIGRRHWAWFGWLGVLCGLAVLIRPVAILLPLLVAIGVILVILRRGQEQGDERPLVPSWWGLLALALGCLAVLTPWMARNRIVAGQFALSDQSGVVLAYFKAAEVALWREDRTADRYLETSLDPSKTDDPHAVWDGIDARLQRSWPGLSDEQRATLNWRNLAQGNKTSLDSFRISNTLARIGWAELAASPWSTAACYLIRCGSILTFPLNLALHPARGVESRRIRSVGLAGPYVVLGLAAVVGLIRRRATLTAAYFPLACTVGLLLATTPQIDPRFRVPLIPMLVFLALLPPRRSADAVGSEDG